MVEETYQEVVDKIKDDEGTNVKYLQALRPMPPTRTQGTRRYLGDLLPPPPYMGYRPEWGSPLGHSLGGYPLRVHPPLEGTSP